MQPDPHVPCSPDTASPTKPADHPILCAAAELGTPTGTDNHEERGNRMRKIVLAATGAAVAVAGIIGLAGPAAAGPAAAETGTTATITAHTTGYQWPSKQSPPVMTGLAPDQQVTALCFTDKGDVVNG